MDKNFAENLIKKIVDLFFILKIEEIEAYGKKFYSFFNLLFFIFCEFHIFINIEEQQNLKNFHMNMKLN